ncbi:MAG TPA: hypothetical protein VEL75_21730 [Candidatus Methylomirabilis sp.]|nr:hypothetical protein [Candidatus Methylomirabilis sp.]
MARPAMYRGDRRRKEDQRKAKQEAKRARKAERKETGTSGPEMGEAATPGDGVTEYVWFSPSNGRTLTTESASPPVVAGVEDWTLVSEPPRS